MKWILCVQSPHVPSQAVNDIFVADPLRDDDVVVAPSVESLLASASRCIEAQCEALPDPNSPLPPPELVAFFCGECVHRTLLSSASPIQHRAERLFAEAREAASSGETVCVGCRVEAASGRSLALRVALQDRLAVGTTPADPSGALTTLGLRFGPPQKLTGFVELQTVWQWEAMADGLMASASFQRVEPHVSLRVHLALVASDGQRTLKSFSFWYLCDAHLNEFLQSVAPSASLAVGAAVVHSSMALIRYGEVAQSLWDLRRRSVLTERTAAAATTPEAETHPPPSADLHERLRQLKEEHTHLDSQLQQLSLPTSNGAVLNVTAIEEARHALAEIASVHDAAERRFSMYSRKGMEERAALARVNAEIDALEKQRAGDLATLSTLTAEKISHSKGIERRSEEHSRLSTEAAALEVAAAEHEKSCLRAARQSDVAVKEERARQQADWALIQEQNSNAVAREQRALAEAFDRWQQEKEAKAAGLEAKAERLQLELDTETAALAEVDLSLSAAREEVRAAAEELSEIEAQAGDLHEKTRQLRERAHPSGKTPDGVAALHREELLLEGNLSAAKDEQQRLAAWLAAHESDVRTQESAAEVRRHDASEYHKESIPRLRQQQRQHVERLLKLEAAERERLEAVATCALFDGMQAEPFLWRRVLHRAEESFHDVRIHQRTREHLVEMNQKVSETLSRVRNAAQLADECTEKFSRAEAEHQKLIAESRSKLANLNLTPSGETPDDPRATTMADRIAVLQKCLASPGITMAAIPGVPPPANPGADGRSLPNLLAGLARIVDHTAAQCRAAHQQEAELQRRLAQLEHELQERTNLSERVLRSVWDGEKSIGEAEELIEQKRAAKKELQEKHDDLREKLKAEYEHAQQVTSRHRAEGQEQLTQQRREYDALVASLQRAEKELRALRLRRDDVRQRRASESDLLQELQHELTRQSTLRDMLHRLNVGQ